MSSSASVHSPCRSIAVVGAGYVGLTLGACLAQMGHRVACLEKDEHRLGTLQRGVVPFHEPGLPELVESGVRSERLRFASDLAAAGGAEFVFIAVGTPSADTGEPDLSALREVAGALRALPPAPRVVAIKSTVPVGPSDWLQSEIGDAGMVASNPEFLAEGSAVHDFFHPARTVIGTTHPAAAAALESLYARLGGAMVVADPRTAEMIKYTSNAFLATKVSFINEIAALCERVGANVDGVAHGVGLDPRVGPHFLRAGIGFGGSCLPKDMRALVSVGRRQGVRARLLESVLEVNELQRTRFVEKAEALLGGFAGRAMGVLGLSFKGRTSDVRESPAIAIASTLERRGAVVRTYDPAAEGEARRVLHGVAFCPDAYEAADGADAILVLSDWPEFADLDWARIAARAPRALVLDGRGMKALRQRVAAAGLGYVGPGMRRAEMPAPMVGAR
jgi:UDPglucose 6-dehydrogenase